MYRDTSFTITYRYLRTECIHGVGFHYLLYGEHVERLDVFAIFTLRRQSQQRRTMLMVDKYSSAYERKF